MSIKKILILSFILVNALDLLIANPTDFNIVKKYSTAEVSSYKSFKDCFNNEFSQLVDILPRIQLDKILLISSPLVDYELWGKTLASNLNKDFYYLDFSYLARRFDAGNIPNALSKVFNLIKNSSEDSLFLIANVDKVMIQQDENYDIIFGNFIRFTSTLYEELHKDNSKMLVVVAAQDSNSIREPLKSFYSYWPKTLKLAKPMYLARKDLIKKTLESYNINYSEEVLNNFAQETNEMYQKEIMNLLLEVISLIDSESNALGNEELYSSIYKSPFYNPNIKGKIKVIDYWLKQNKIEAEGNVLSCLAKDLEPLNAQLICELIEDAKLKDTCNKLTLSNLIETYRKIHPALSCAPLPDVLKPICPNFNNIDKEEFEKKNLDIGLKSKKYDKSNFGIKVLQYKVALQSDKEEGGGRLSCGYHALKNSLAIINALTQNWSIDELVFYLTSEEVVKKLFGEQNADWRRILNNDQDYDLDSNAIKKIIEYGLLEDPGIKIEDLNLGYNTKVVFVGDKFNEENDIIREYENYKEEGNVAFYELVNRIKNNEDCIGIFIINDSSHWYSCVVCSRPGQDALVFLADSFNVSKLNNSKFRQIIKILNPISFSLVVGPSKYNDYFITDFNESDYLEYTNKDTNYTDIDSNDLTNSKFLKFKNQITSSKVSLDRLGGSLNKELEDWLNELKENILSNEDDTFKSNLILYGSPGNGKTTLARAIANNLNYDYLEVSAGDLGNKFQHSGAESISYLFKAARYHNRPVVVCIDELDSVINSRKSSSSSDEKSEAISELIRQLNIEYEDIPLNKGRTIFIGCTNKYKDLPNTIKSRRCTGIEIKSPSYEERKELIKFFINSKGNPIDESDLNSLAKKTKNWSVDDIKTMIGKSYSIRKMELLALVKENKTKREDITIEQKSITKKEIDKGYNFVKSQQDNCKESKLKEINDTLSDYQPTINTASLAVAALGLGFGMYKFCSKKDSNSNQGPNNSNASNNEKSNRKESSEVGAEAGCILM